MAIDNTNIELRKDDVVAATPVDVDILVYSEDEIEVYYGNVRILATDVTDYGITLDNAGDVTPVYPTTFALTPTATLITKINALITAHPSDEENVIWVRRRIGMTTDFLETDAFLRAKIAREFDRTIMRFQQHDFDITELLDFKLAYLLDSEQVHAEAAQVAADAAQVALDRIATAADRVATGNDRTAVATNKGLVDTAAATVAADKAIVAADKATVAADKANVATNKGLVDTAKAAVDVAKAAADADVVLTHADVVLTHADVVLTHADVVAAAASAASAAGSAASLTNVLTLIADWDASAGTFPNTASRKKGWTYIVTVAGTVNGVQFGVDDKLVAAVDNASTTTYAGNWFKIEGGTITSSQVTAALGYTPVNPSSLGTAASDNSSATATANTVAKRDSNGDLTWRYAFMNTTPIYDNTNILGIMSLGTGGFVQNTNSAHVKLYLGYASITGNETWAGLKTFSSIPILPNADPTANNEAARKQYVDGKVTYLEGLIAARAPIASSYQLPVGATAYLMLTASGPISNGNTVAGSSLAHPGYVPEYSVGCPCPTRTPAVYAAGGALTGTWRNDSGVAVYHSGNGNRRTGTWTRTA